MEWVICTSRYTRIFRWKNDYWPVEYKFKISCEYFWIIEPNFLTDLFGEKWHLKKIQWIQQQEILFMKEVLKRPMLMLVDPWPSLKSISFSQTNN